MTTSMVGPMDARPGYNVLTLSKTSPSHPVRASRKLPPTGTMKFLSVLCTTTSTRPLRHADVISRHVSLDWMPYALLMMCGTSSRLQTLPTPTTSSGLRGAKQLVVVRTHATFSAPTDTIASSIASTSVTSDVPSLLSSTHTTVYPAAVIDLTHVFWSMRDQTTTVASGRELLKASIDSTSAIPVATGMTSALPTSCRPATPAASLTR